MQTQFLFAYGTLRSREPEHATHGPRALGRTTAVAAGSLYLLKEGYPIIVVPRETVLAEASADWQSYWDGALDRLTEIHRDVAIDSSARVEGELLEIPLEPEALEASDVWEGFSIGSECVYHRLAIPVQRADGAFQAAWAYGCFAPPKTATPIEGNRWDRSGLR